MAYQPIRDRFKAEGIAPREPRKMAVGIGNERIGGPQPMAGNPAANPIENVNLDINTQLDEMSFPGESRDIFDDPMSIDMPTQPFPQVESSFTQTNYADQNSFLAPLNSILLGMNDTIFGGRDKERGNMFSQRGIV